jgi:deazaflavin-dependent oxidoreductase (nitroreductase family)
MSNPENLRFSSYGRTWAIVVRGPRGMAFDRWLVRRTGLSAVSFQYAFAGRNPYYPTLLLTTIGAKTKQLRSAALPYIPWRGGYVVVGSKGGGPINPNWVANIRNNELCWITVHRKEIAVTGRVVKGDERKELFDHVVQHKANVARYQERADGYGREIPLVLLTPIDPAAAPRG